MQEIYQMFYLPGLPLKTMGLIIGIWLIASHAFALAMPGVVKPFLKEFSRNDTLGIVLVILAFAWTFMIWTCMDLGELFTVERPVQMILIAGCVGVIIFVREFLSVRALGFLMILAAAPILNAAFLKEPTSRLLIVAFAYVIALKGMFYVGIPYWFRDQVNWLLKKNKVYTAGALAGLGFGILVLVCSFGW